jgi:hypothetical protein
VSQPARVGVGLESAYSGPRVELRPPVHPALPRFSRRLGSRLLVDTVHLGSGGNQGRHGYRSTIEVIINFCDASSVAVSPSVVVAEGNIALSAVWVMPPCGVPYQPGISDDAARQEVLLVLPMAQSQVEQVEEL